MTDEQEHRELAKVIDNVRWLGINLLDEAPGGDDEPPMNRQENLKPVEPTMSKPAVETTTYNKPNGQVIIHPIAFESDLENNAKSAFQTYMINK